MTFIFISVAFGENLLNIMPLCRILNRLREGVAPMSTILIVDDVAENVRLLKNVLGDFGQILFAKDGVTALAQAEKHRPDIILLDVVMPGINGYETCRRLKAHPATSDIPVLFITGATGEQDEAMGLAQGAIDYITKPFSPEIVRARVRNHLAFVRAHAELRQANEAMRKFKTAVESSSAAIMMTDRDARIEYVNEAFVEINGYTAAEVLGKKTSILRSGLTAEDTYRELWQTILGGVPWRGELCNRRKDGMHAWQDVAIAPVHDEQGMTTHFVAVCSDITERKRMEEDLRRMAITDELTGIANRRCLIQVGEQELQRIRRSSEPLCVIMIDIDNFKHINDTYGHPAGDAVIQAAARVCAESVREIDTVGRMGGEEFAIILPLTDQAGATELAERLRGRISETVVPWGADGEIRFTVSMGVAEFKPHVFDFASLLGMADQGLYRAKNLGRNRVESMQ